MVALCPPIVVDGSILHSRDQCVIEQAPKCHISRNIFIGLSSDCQRRYLLEFSDVELQDIEYLMQY